MSPLKCIRHPGSKKMVTLSKYFKSHRTIKKRNVIEVPKVFCLASFHTMQFSFA